MPDARRDEVSALCPQTVTGRSSRLDVHPLSQRDGATRGVMVSTYAFLAYHPCKSAGSSLGRGLNSRALVCGML